MRGLAISRLGRFGSLTLVLLASSAALALLPPDPGLAPDTASQLLMDAAFFSPELVIPSSNVALARLNGVLPNARDWELFFARYGGDFQVKIDPRSGTPTNINGHIPFLPGTGVDNHVTLRDLERALGGSVTEVTPEVVAALFLQWVYENQGVLALDPAQLGEPRVTQVAEFLWQIYIPQQAAGIPVRHGYLAATINHGNLILVGTGSWRNVGLSTQPAIEADDALNLGFARIGGWYRQDLFWQQPTLEIVPVSSLEIVPAGSVGSGYEHRLVWMFGFQRPPDMARWEVLVDAHSGEVLSLEDTNHYATERIVGAIYPLTDTEICPTPETCGSMQPDYPMPFANTGLSAPNNYTDSSGKFDYTSGTVTTTLNGRYIRMLDNCGSISASASGSINLGGTNAQHDCTTPGSGGNGNTPASRSGFFELNKIVEMARGWLPGNTWLGNQLTSNMNINLTCNAFWNGSTVNFYRSGGGCRNTGEIAAVFDHEWGHGLDDNDANGTLSNSSEGYADIAGILRLEASCVGYGFFTAGGGSCGNTIDGTGRNVDEDQTAGVHCATNCSGVRDADWAMHADNTPDTPQNHVCPRCNASSGPCGRQVHCAAAPQRQAGWDLAARDLQAAPFNYDRNTAFIIANRIFYLGSGNITTWYACNCGGGTSDGCSANAGYMQWLAADDDNGNLSDGTPHMTAIYAAFNRHNIACATPAPTNGGCAAGPSTATTLNVSAANNQANLSWSAVAGATRYWVFRGEGYGGCDFGKAKIAEVTGTTYADTAVANGTQYCYSVVAAGTSDSCFGPGSNCACVTPLACPAITVSPATLPGGTVGSSYSQTITASGGTGPYTFAVTAGSLPGGLSLNAGSGLLSGTPTAQGTFNFTVTATDAGGCPGSQAYAMVIACPTVTLSPATLPNGTVGTAYSQTVSASGGTGPYTFAVTAGVIPSGLTLSASGLLAGTPTMQGPWSFTITATDAAGCSGAQAYGITIDCATIVLAPPTLPAGARNVPYSQTLSASGGTAPYTYAVTAGTLPAGLTLDPATGVLAGTPTTVGTSTFTVTATDATGCTGTQAYTLDINCANIAISPPGLADGTEGIAYSVTFTASGGTPPYTWATSGNVPAGLSIDSVTGELAGVPSAAGGYGFDVLVTDAAGCTAFVAMTGGGARQLRFSARAPYSMAVAPAVDYVLGEGLGQPNGNGARIYKRDGTASAVSFTAYGAGQFGTNVAAGDIDGAIYGEILTGPGPGAVYGPHVRAWSRAGTAMAKVSYFAYGTLRFGANVMAADVDGDGFAEIVSGPGPGAVFGPHVRGWNFDATTLSAMAKINFFSYGTLKYGVNVDGGNVDGDAFAEILTGPGAGSIFGPQVKGWNFDATAVTAMARINFFAFAIPQFGCHIAGGDVDADGYAEIAVTPGAGPALTAQFKGFDYDGATIAALAGFDTTPFGTLYGGSVGLGDLAADGGFDLVAGAGPDPSATSRVIGMSYGGAALTPLPGSGFTPFSGLYGVTVGAGACGHF